MRRFRIAIRGATLAALAMGVAAAQPVSLAGVWFAEYGTARERVQEISQRQANGRWRAELRIFRDCREAERFMVEGSWTFDGAVLTHVMRRRGSWMVAPRPIEFQVVEATPEALRLRPAEGEDIRAQPVPQTFRFPEPACGPALRG